MNISDSHPVELSELREYPNNPRKHSAQQIEEMKRSLSLFGQYRPFVLNEAGEVLAGNGMLQAMRELGWETGQAVTLQGATTAEEKKLVLADNRIGGMGLTDFDAVDAMLAEIGDFEVTGYDADTLRDLLGSVEESLEAAKEYGILEPKEVERITGRPVPQHFTAGEEDAPGGAPISEAQQSSSESGPIDLDDEAYDVMEETRKTTRELVVCPECGHSW